MVFTGACTVPPSNAPTVATTTPTSPPVTSPPVSPTAAPVQVPFTVCSSDDEYLEALAESDGNNYYLQGEAGGFEINDDYYCGGSQLQITASTDGSPSQITDHTFAHWMMYAENAEGIRIGSWNVSDARQTHNAADASGAYCDPQNPASTIAGADQESPFVLDWSPPLEDSGTITFRGVFRLASLDVYWFSTLTIEPDGNCGWSATAPRTAEPTTSEPTTSEPTTSEPTTSEPTTSEPTLAPTAAPTSAPATSGPTPAPSLAPTTAAPSQAPTEFVNYCLEGYADYGTRYNAPLGRVSIVYTHEQCSARCTQYSGPQFAGGCKGYMTGMYFGMLFCRSYGRNWRSKPCATWAHQSNKGTYSGELGSIHPRSGQLNLGGSCCTNGSLALID